MSKTQDMAVVFVLLLIITAVIAAFGYALGAIFFSLFPHFFFGAGCM
jgi:hypothetical protein